MALERSGLNNAILSLVLIVFWSAFTVSLGISDPFSPHRLHRKNRNTRGGVLFSCLFHAIWAQEHAERYILQQDTLQKKIRIVGMPQNFASMSGHFGMFAQSSSTSWWGHRHLNSRFLPKQHRFMIGSCPPSEPTKRKPSYFPLCSTDCLIGISVMADNNPHINWVGFQPQQIP